MTAENVPENFPKGLALMERAAQFGNILACRAIKKIYEDEYIRKYYGLQLPKIDDNNE